MVLAIVEHHSCLEVLNTVLERRIHLHKLLYTRLTTLIFPRGDYDMQIVIGVVLNPTDPGAELFNHFSVHVGGTFHLISDVYVFLQIL